MLPLDPKYVKRDGKIVMNIWYRTIFEGIVTFVINLDSEKPWQRQRPGYGLKLGHNCFLLYAFQLANN
jgi:hypothetical protein